LGWAKATIVGETWRCYLVAAGRNDQHSDKQQQRSLHGSQSAPKSNSINVQ
jgi:hypothetical protein